MNDRTLPRTAAACLTGAAALAMAGFTALGSVFDYPAILKQPTTEILAQFRDHQAAVVGWFLVLVVSAALLAPAAVLLGRLASGRAGRWITVVGLAAATVQVVGLSRWAIFVPALSQDALDRSQAADAQRTFELLHTWLGTLLGETVGYALTATFTVLVAHALAPRPLARLGYLAAGLIATGVVIPLGVQAASLTNFVGYVAWCLWLVALSVVLWRTPPAYEPSAIPEAVTGTTSPDRSGNRSGNRSH